MFPFRRPEDLARYQEPLRKAELPERPTDSPDALPLHVKHSGFAIEALARTPTSAIGPSRRFAETMSRDAQRVSATKRTFQTSAHVCKRADAGTSGFSAALAACQSCVLAKSLYAGTIARISRFRGVAP